MPFRQIMGGQLYGGDIDTFATSLAAIRLFLLDEHETGVAPELYVHDMLLHSPERQRVIWTEAERAVADPDVDEPGTIDEVEFDAVVGNPPYGARKPAYKADVYRRLYGTTEPSHSAPAVSRTGDHDTYAMFIANGIERLKEGGRLCLITNDSFRSLTTYAPPAALRPRSLQDRRDPSHRHKALRRRELSVRGHGHHDAREVLGYGDAAGTRDAARRLRP